MSFLIGWAFYKFNPWKARFNQVLRRMLQAGLVDHYKFETWQRMKKEYMESDEPKLEFKERPIASGLSLDDMQGVFYLAGLILAAGLLSLLMELCTDAINKRPDSEISSKTIMVQKAKMARNY